MRVIIFFALAFATSADIVPSKLQQMVDSLFDSYLPQKVAWEEVKACRTKCGKDEDCLASCPKYDCPFSRISAQCDLFNSTMSSSKECHRACDHHDFACHFKCPMAKPTSVKELVKIGEAMLCHISCGKKGACHKSACSNPWSEKQERCGKLVAVVSCLHSGGNRSFCPHLDNETRTQLLEEPQSIVKDVADHIVDYLLPLPAGQEATREEVKACHIECGHDFECHKKCPTGSWGILRDQCDTISFASACHQTCENLVTKCPLAKMKCHFKCPMSMPTSVKELRGFMDHVACHATCGQDKACHETCPSSVWSQKKRQCMVYNKMMACHQACGHFHDCHMNCPHLDEAALKEVSKDPTRFVKEVISTIIV